MKIKIYLSLVMLAVVGLSYNVSAQYTLLGDFTGSGAFTGIKPNQDQNLINVGGVLYGMTNEGGAFGKGVVFKINPDGTAYTKLFDFNDTIGAYPLASLISDGTYLYGTTSSGGANLEGTVFKIKPDGTGHSKLYDFEFNASGSSPSGSLYSDGTYLYGTTKYGGANASGTIFKIKPDGTGFVKIFDFDSSTGGAEPTCHLISDGTSLYGTTQGGGATLEGTVFKINPDGTGYTTIVNLTSATGSAPAGSLISDGTFLYGMASSGTAGFEGSIFKVKPDGTGYTMLYDFVDSTSGSNPTGTLFSDGTSLYGMTAYGGIGVGGTAFKINPDGTNFTILLNFAGASNGQNPGGSFISDGTHLYGMTKEGGINGQGTIFKILPNGTGYNKLWTFIGASNGASPRASLTKVGTDLYGTTSSGGTFNMGTIFKIKPDGTGYSKILDFDGTINGSRPQGSLFYDGTNLYGTTSNGGTDDLGTIFKIMPDGTNYTLLLDCSDSTGTFPTGSLISDGTYLYGMTSGGGSNISGVIFKIKPDGTNYTRLLNFNGTTNGSNPYGSLISDNTFLYGMTSYGGANTNGTVFKIKPDGTGYLTLLDFDGTTNGDSPNGSLISDGTYLYGMTYSGGTNGQGTIFKIKTDGTGYLLLQDFSGGISNGAYPYGDLLAVGNSLYGMAGNGGIDDYGILFKIMPDGTGFTKLMDFNGAVNGLNPTGSLIVIGTTLYGMTGFGGPAEVGTIFKYELSGAGIKEVVVEKQIYTYPNPTNGVFTLQLNNTLNLNNGQVNIYNELGENVYSRRLDQLNNGTIDISSQPSGIYFVNVQEGATTYSNKINIVR